MDKSTNKRNKIGSMNYKPEGTHVIDETGKLILPIVTFRNELFKSEAYDNMVHERDLRYTGAFTAMLIRMADQIDEGIIPENAKYAVYDTQTKEMNLYGSVEIKATRRRLKITNDDHIYIYLMRKFEGQVRLNGTGVIYEEGAQISRYEINAREVLSKYFVKGKSGKETRAVRRGRSY